MAGEFPTGRSLQIYTLGVWRKKPPKFARMWGIYVAQTLIRPNLLCYQLPSTMQLMNTMMIAPGGHSSFAHHAFHTACYYKWPNTPYNSTSFSRCPSLAWLPTHSTLAIKISVIEHINYTHPETAMITISHVWMDYSHLPQNDRGSAMTLAKRGGEGGRGGRS